ncbi:MAG: lipid-A-disaccharide synthase [Candidatus Omnitrophica bacterium]|nr:lipid-A-disaccharide synthase [Candidatus Omnitrophota bacterium]
MPKKIVIVAGEASGDFHSASLIKALKDIHPHIDISGIGGERMRQAGCKIIADYSQLAIIGFTDVLKNIKKIERIFNDLLEHVDKTSPDAVVLVDYPGFNLKLAQALKKRNVKVIYYISPQVWAWWRGRIKTIKQFVDKILVVFKFEQALYRENGIDAQFVGHPLLDIAQAQYSEEDFLKRLGLSAHATTIGLAPGSRKMEVKRILPVLLKSAKVLKENLPFVQFAVLKAPELPKKIFVRQIQKHDIHVSLCENNTYDFLNICDFVLVASGTATLETAIMKKPMLIVYKVSFLNWLIARCLIRIPYIGLVNVVAGKKVVPEFVQFRARPNVIARKAMEMLEDHEYLTTVKEGLQEVRTSLGSPGASKRAAEIVLKCLE